jgi:cobalt/nickel transport system ATP-binding protein
MDRGKLILEGTTEAVFAQRDVLEQLQLGVPLAIELIDHIKAIVDKSPNSKMPNFEELQQQILDTRRRL